MRAENSVERIQRRAREQALKAIQMHGHDLKNAPHWALDAIDAVMPHLGAESNDGEKTLKTPPSSNTGVIYPCSNKD